MESILNHTFNFMNKTCSFVLLLKIGQKESIIYIHLIKNSFNNLFSQVSGFHYLMLSIHTSFK
jgi:hypothetical protein